MLLCYQTGINSNGAVNRQEQAMSEKKVLTIIEAAEELGISKGSAYEAARTGKIPTIRIGRRLIVPRAAFERMLDQAGEAKVT